jgi:hypothetical protein
LTCEWDRALSHYPSHVLILVNSFKGGHIFQIRHTQSFQIIKIAITHSQSSLSYVQMSTIACILAMKKKGQTPTMPPPPPASWASLLLLHPELVQSFLFVNIISSTLVLIIRLSHRQSWPDICFGFESIITLTSTWLDSLTRLAALADEAKLDN